MDVPWNVPVPVMLNGQAVVPWVAVPVAAQGMTVSLWVATTVPTSVIPPEQVAVKSPLNCEPVCDVIFHCRLPQLCTVGNEVAAGPFLVATGVRTEVTGPAIGEIFKEIRGMREKPPVGDELALAKDSIVRSLPAQFETSRSVTGSTANIYIYDLGLDYYSKIASRLSTVDGAQVKAAADKYLVPEKMTVIAVGDRAKIAAEVQKLKLGPSEVRNADGAVQAPPATK